MKQVHVQQIISSQFEGRSSCTDFNVTILLLPVKEHSGDFTIVLTPKADPRCGFIPIQKLYAYRCIGKYISVNQLRGRQNLSLSQTHPRGPAPFPTASPLDLSPSLPYPNQVCSRSHSHKNEAKEQDKNASSHQTVTLKSYVFKLQHT